MNEPIPPYLKKQIDYISSGNEIKPGVYHSVIKHDDWCNLLSNKGGCNCDPTVLPPMSDSEYIKYLKEKNNG